MREEKNRFEIRTQHPLCFC